LADQPYEVVAEDLSRAQSLYAEFQRAERERHRQEMDAWRAGFERGFLRPYQRACLDLIVDAEAEKAARPAISKPLSRQARRRNRGRVRAARLALGRHYHQPIQWVWLAPGGFHG
jgi:hypothetical protein